MKTQSRVYTKLLIDRFTISIELLETDTYPLSNFLCGQGQGKEMKNFLELFSQQIASTRSAFDFRRGEFSLFLQPG